jgi:GNAT superfamily N-acetyltransferase
MVALAQTPDTLTTTYLEMTHPQQLNGTLKTADDVRVEAMQVADTGFYRYLYRSVGEKWRWRDRLLLSDSDLKAELSCPETRVYVLYVSGAPAGYIELAREGESVEIAYFGLREEYHGRGLGKFLLSYGVHKAWMELEARRVWVHTCNLDGPHALSNYRRRGFRVFKEEREPMPERYQ